VRRGLRIDDRHIPTKLAAKQIAALRGKPRASFLLAVDDIARRLLTVFETRDRCILPLVAEHTRTVSRQRGTRPARHVARPHPADRTARS
jgi:hypothetical protein